MILELTERDKKLLIGLGFFCLVTVLFFCLILPLQSANQEWGVQIAAGEERIQELQKKMDSLTDLEMEYENRRKRLEKLQSGLYPMLDDCGVDRLLTEKTGAMGLHIRGLEIGNAVPCLPEEASDFEKGSGEPDGICSVRARMEVTGSCEKIEQLLDIWGTEDAGIRVAGFTWLTDGEGTADGTLSVQMEILMCRKEEERE